MASFSPRTILAGGSDCSLLFRYTDAAQDARQVIALDRRWVKGWSRLAAALFAMEEWSEVCLSLASMLSSICTALPFWERKKAVSHIMPLLLHAQSEIAL